MAEQSVFYEIELVHDDRGRLVEPGVLRDLLLAAAPLLASEHGVDLLNVLVEEMDVA